MPATRPRHTPEELARLGEQLFTQQVRPTLKSEDEGKFVAIDVETGNFEIDVDDYAAVERLRARIPTADVWLMCVGYPTTYRMGVSAVGNEPLVGMRLLARHKLEIEVVPGGVVEIFPLPPIP